MLDWASKISPIFSLFKSKAEENPKETLLLSIGAFAVTASMLSVFKSAPETKFDEAARTITDKLNLKHRKNDLWRWEKEDCESVYTELLIHSALFELENKSELRDKRLSILSSEGEEAYVEEIKEQLKEPVNLELAQTLFSKLKLSKTRFFKRLHFHMRETTGFHQHFVEWKEDWDKVGRPSHITSKLREEPLQFTDEQKENMLEWQHKREVNKVRDLMKKASEQESREEFKERLLISNICLQDDFYNEFGLDQEEVAQFLKLS